MTEVADVRRSDAAATSRSADRDGMRTGLAPTATPTATATGRLDLVVTGMTCAACAMRIERTLNRIDGVSASVNYATERAAVDYDPDRASSDELVDAVASIGYGARLPTPSANPSGDDRASSTDPDRSAAKQHMADLRQRFIVAALLGAPVLLISMTTALQFRNWQWACFAMAAPVATWAALPFHRAAVKNARHGEATMDTLVSVGVLAAFLWSTYALLFTAAGDSGVTMAMTVVPRQGVVHHLYLEVASTTVALILAGRWFEARAKDRAGGALRALLHLGAADVSVVVDGAREERRPIAELRVGDRFIVRPGEKVATDGVIDEGASSIDISLITGESVPVDVAAGDEVIGATVNVDGRLVVRATRVGADTALAQIGRLVEAAQSGKAPVQRLADRVASVFVPIVMVLAAATLGFWFARTGSLTEAIAPAVAVLIIACPCALGLATPTALLVGTGRGAQMGILIKGPEVLETSRRIDTIILDKTGTVTTGEMNVVDVVGDDPLEVVRLAAAVEQHSEHPIARAIVRHASSADGPGAPTAEHVTEFVNQRGIGTAAKVDGGLIQVGRAEAGVLTGGLADAFAASESDGNTVVVVTRDGSAVGLISLADTVKPSSAQAVRNLDAMGIDAFLVTGDNRASALAVAAAVGISTEAVHAGVLPEEKLAIVRRLQAEGRVVAVVGDGVNDAAALAQADLGIAMGSGTDVAMEASDITLVRSELTAAADAIRLGRRTLAVIKGNLFWAFAYNAAALPLAMAWLLSPVVASAAMACSSVFVVSNSLRLRRFRSS
ncbi:MAG: actP [Ilumatobacteraceae bacterium]|nr:actP [Ilumatobacteraceae bacterium]